MRKKHPEHVNLERWLVSYADFITLLFAFFVIMYAISQADIAKFKKVSTSIKAAFSSTSAVGVVDLNGTAGGTSVNILDNTEVPGGRVQDMPAGKTNVSGDPDPELREIQDRLEESISLELGVTDLSDKVQMQFDSRGLVVRLAAKDFFGPGDAEVRPDLRPILDRIGKIVLATKHLIRIEGHTDPSEAGIAKARGFSSDWELSAARASWAVQYWMKRFDVNPSRLGIAGYSHYRPLTEKTDEINRGKNRRIEIIVLNNQFED